MNTIQAMINQVTNLQNQILEFQENCQHINKVCEGDYKDGKPIEDDIFSDPFAEGGDFAVKANGTIIECNCPECLKKWVEIKL